MEDNLRIPGPTPMPPSVREALSQQMISHRGFEYEAVHKRVIEGLQYFLQTNNDVFLITGSGMAGLETAIVNFFSPGDKILSLACGEFGRRWAGVAKAFGAAVVEEKFEMGTAVSVKKLTEILGQHTDIRGVLITLNETSTGVLNPVARLAEAIKRHPAKPLILVDGISGLGAIDLALDKIGVDVAVSATQKAWMAPPGMAIITVSQKAWKRHETAKMPRYYLDLTQYKEFSLKNQTPATPAVATLYGLDAALKLMMTEGKEAVFGRHLRLKDYTRKNLKDLGLKLMVKDEAASPTVTSFYVPDHKEAKIWLKEIKETYKIILTGGMEEMKDRIIRVAHMGWCSEADLEPVIKALKETLK